MINLSSTNFVKPDIWLEANTLSNPVRSAGIARIHNICLEGSTLIRSL